MSVGIWFVCFAPTRTDRRVTVTPVSQRYLPPPKTTWPTGVHFPGQATNRLAQKEIRGAAGTRSDFSAALPGSSNRDNPESDGNWE